jgi:hypothetical protein
MPAGAQTMDDWKALTNKAVQDVLACYQSQLPKALQEKASADAFIEAGHTLCDTQREVLRQVSTVALRKAGMPELQIGDRIASSMEEIDTQARNFYEDQLKQAK